MCRTTSDVIPEHNIIILQVDTEESITYLPFYNL